MLFQCLEFFRFWMVLFFAEFFFEKNEISMDWIAVRAPWISIVHPQRSLFPCITWCVCSLVKSSAISFWSHCWNMFDETFGLGAKTLVTWNYLEPVCPLFSGLNPQRKPFPIKTGVIWVPGIQKIATKSIDLYQSAKQSSEIAIFWSKKTTWGLDMSQENPLMNAGLSRNFVRTRIGDPIRGRWSDPGVWPVFFDVGRNRNVWKGWYVSSKKLRSSCKICYFFGW